MDLLFMAVLLGSIYFIVYCRLMMHMCQTPQPRRSGLMLVLSLPPLRGLDSKGRRYRRLYWCGWLVMLATLGAGLWWRYPHIAAGLAGN